MQELESIIFRTIFFYFFIVLLLFLDNYAEKNFYFWGLSCLKKCKETVKKEQNNLKKPLFISNWNYKSNKIDKNFGSAYKIIEL